MTKQKVIQILEENKNPAGIKRWNEFNVNDLKTYGIGVTKLKKIAKTIGKNHELALDLWDIDYYDALCISCLVDEPKKVTREQIERQLNKLNFWMLSNLYCNSLLAKVPFMKQLSEEFTDTNDNLKKRCGFLLLYEIAKSKKNIDDDYFINYIKIISEQLQDSENYVKDAMNNALFMIGSRNKNLNNLALEAAKNIGKVHVDYGDNSCQAIDVEKRLLSDIIQNKLSKL